jgi:pimeloyl-ACP methyl ester carboxylesterase
MWRPRCAAVTLSALLAGVAGAQELAFRDAVELFVAAPEGTGPFPVILFVHGHQAPERPGARAFTRLPRRPALATVDEGRLDAMRARGWLAAAVSMPGYGGTPGPPDFAGPRSQAAVRAALDHLLARTDADRGTVVVYGVSRGAATASMVATADARITGLILVAGLYDLGEAYPTGDRRLDANIEREAGTSPEAYAARSALRRADRIRARALVLHGGDDLRGGSLDQARRLAARVGARLRVFEGTPHAIPIAAQWEEIDRFLADLRRGRRRDRSPSPARPRRPRRPCRPRRRPSRSSWCRSR